MPPDPIPARLLRPELPAFLQVEITSACNLRCTMCPLTEGLTASSAAAGHMSDATWDRVLALASRVKQVVIAGFGEPLANPACLTLIRQLDALGVRVGIATNGTLLSPDLCQKLVRIPNLTQINVSIDSPDPDAYRTIRGGDVGRAMDGLRTLMLAVDDPLRVTVSSVVTAKSLRTLARLPPILAATGVRRLVLQSLVVYSPRMEEDDLLPDRGTHDHAAALREAATRHQIELVFSHARRFGAEVDRVPDTASPDSVGAAHDATTTRQCGLPWASPFIDKDGRVFACCLASSHPTAVLGNLREETLEEVWSGARYQRFRRSLLGGDPMPEVCRGCNAAPLGPHPFLEYGGEVCARESILHGRRWLRLVVRNVGRWAWEPADRLHVGTVAPQDRPSAFYDSSWLSGNRVGALCRDRVGPGERVAFEFRVRPTREPQVEAFQLVFEERFWLPDTRFEIGPVQTWAGRGRRLLGGVLARLVPRDVSVADWIPKQK